MGMVSRLKQIAFGIAWSLFILFLFLWVNSREDEQVHRIHLSQAEALFQQVIDVRGWNAFHGGVYVKVDDQTRPNPYLDVPRRDIVAEDGQMYTLINPAFMTRQLAETGEEKHNYKIHITGLTPLRPENKPSKWEKIALKAFEEGASVQSGLFEDEEGEKHLIYMKPLTMEKSCLECHSQQGYSVGDIGGGISVSFPAGNHLAVREAFRYQSLGALGIIWLLGIGMFIVVNLYMKEKSQEIEKYRGLALIDDLTGLNNRRAFTALVDNQLETAERFSEKALLLFMDIDGMKSINDNFGHNEGDFALRLVADALLSSVRGSDVIGRYGGDEFVVFLPKSSLEHRELALARILQTVESKNSQVTKDYTLSISIGVAEFDPLAPVSLEKLVSIADQDLYGVRDNG
ncbi:MAG: diguanylate cyclase [bacterium]